MCFYLDRMFKNRDKENKTQQNINPIYFIIPRLGRNIHRPYDLN